MSSHDSRRTSALCVSALCKAAFRPLPTWRAALHERNRAADLFVLERPQPTRASSRRIAHPGSNRLDHQHVAQARNDGLAAGLQLLRFGGNESQRALQPLGLGCAPRIDVHQVGKQSHQLRSGWMVECHRAAQHRSGRSAAAVAQQLIPLRDVLPRQIE